MSSSQQQPNCDTCPLKQADAKLTWNWPRFIIGKLGNKFIAWVVYMVLQFLALLTPRVNDQWSGYILIISAIVTAIFMLAGAVDIMVQNAKVNADIKMGVNK